MFKQNNKKLFIFFALFSLVFYFSFFIPPISFAQTGGNSLYLTTSPEIPEAGKIITVSASYALSDLSRARISWYVNNSLQLQGIGEKKVTLPMGKVGERTLVRISIITQEGKLLTQTIALTPSTVDILWETDTYTPALYKGKALPTQGGTLRLTAVPTFIKNGIALNTKDLYYSWDAGGKSFGAPVKGRSTLEIPFDKNSTKTNVTVFITNTEKTIVGKESISIPLATSDVVFYENSPVLGILYNKTIPSTFTSPKKTFSLIAEPFNIPRTVFLEGRYAWSVNEKESSSNNDESVRIFTLSQEGTANGGVSTIEFSITNKALLGGVLKKVLSLTL